MHNSPFHDLQGIHNKQDNHILSPHHDVHKKRLLTYLKLANKKLGLLVNFNVSSLKDKESVIRIIN